MERIEADVCVAGAGFAGLVAALRLQQAGSKVAVLEARDRVGGRTWTEMLDTADTDTGGGQIWIDRGGAWLGPGQDPLYALAKEMGVTTYPTFTEGESVLVLKDKPVRYKGTIPLRMNPWTLANLGSAMSWIESHAKKIPLEAPWTAKDAHELDAQTAEAWISSMNVPSGEARDLLRTIMVEVFASDPAEVSMLHVLYHFGSAGGMEKNLAVEGGAQQDRIVGGTGALAEKVGEELGSAAVHLSSPVRQVKWGDGFVEVASDEIIVSAKHVVMAIPATLSSSIRYDPPLPGDRALLNSRLPVGSVYKIALVYDDAWWRTDGLTGESVSLRSPITSTIDAGTDTVPPGILNAFAAGPHARKLALLDPDERRRKVIGELTARFGPKAAKPQHYIEQDWAAEEYTRGCFMVHYPPGVLTSFGPAIRDVIGPIHFAGTETSPQMNGFIDGAVRSGERAAKEVLAAL